MWCASSWADVFVRDDIITDPATSQVERTLAWVLLHPEACS